MQENVHVSVVLQNACSAFLNGGLMRQKRTLHVGNVPRAVDHATLLELFRPYGSIEDLRVAGLADHDTRYWFVQFADNREAKEALRVDGTSLQGSNIRVSFAKGTKARQTASTTSVAPRSDVEQKVAERPTMRGSRATNREKISRTVFIEGIEVEYTALEIAKFFSYCGSVMAVRRSPVRSNPFKNRVWVEFSTPAEASRAIACNGQYFDQFLLSIQQSETAICTNELTQPIRYVYETGIYHEIQRRSLYRDLGLEYFEPSIVPPLS